MDRTGYLLILSVIALSGLIVLASIVEGKHLEITTTPVFEDSLIGNGTIANGIWTYNETRWTTSGCHAGSCWEVNHSLGIPALTPGGALVLPVGYGGGTPPVPPGRYEFMVNASINYSRINRVDFEIKSNALDRLTANSMYKRINIIYEEAPEIYTRGLIAMNYGALNESFWGNGSCRAFNGTDAEGYHHISIEYVSWTHTYTLYCNNESQITWFKSGNNSMNFGVFVSGTSVLTYYIRNVGMYEDTVVPTNGKSGKVPKGQVK